MNSSDPKEHDDTIVSSLRLSSSSPESRAAYNNALVQILTSSGPTVYKKCQTITGYGRPCLLSTLPHLLSLSRGLHALHYKHW